MRERERERERERGGNTSDKIQLRENQDSGKSEEAQRYRLSRIALRRSIRGSLRGAMFRVIGAAWCIRLKARGILLTEF